MKTKSRTKTARKQNTSLSLPRNYASIRVTKPDGSKKSASELQQELANLCIDVYLSGGQRFTPLPPFVLVRVLPKDMVSEGGILLPNQKQNKPVHEGIVLETYRPYEEEVVLKREWADGNSEEYVGKIRRECAIKVGQRVAYPHYEGVPHKFLGEDYVLIRQSADQIKFTYCQVLGIIDNQGDMKIARQIAKLMQKFNSVTTSGASMSRGADPATVAK